MVYVRGEMEGMRNDEESAKAAEEEFTRVRLGEESEPSDSGEEGTAESNGGAGGAGSGVRRRSGGSVLGRGGRAGVAGRAGRGGGGRVRRGVGTTGGLRGSEDKVVGALGDAVHWGGLREDEGGQYREKEKEKKRTNGVGREGEGSDGEVDHAKTSDAVNLIEESLSASVGKTEERKETNPERIVDDASLSLGKHRRGTGGVCEVAGTSGEKMEGNRRKRTDGTRSKQRRESKSPIQRRFERQFPGSTR
jgi:hypothetical protein